MKSLEDYIDEESFKNLAFDLKTFDICGWMKKHNITTIYGLDVEQWCNLRRIKIMNDMLDHSS